MASEISQVRPQVNGVVIEQLFKEGSQVNKGQPLYKIDSSLYRDSVDEAAGNLSLAKATVNSTRLQAERYKELIKVNGVSQQELDNALSAYEQAKATVAVNEAVLKTARTNLRYTQVTAPISGRIGRSSITRGALVTSAQTDPLATIQKLDPMYVDLTQSSDEYMALRKQLTENGIKPLNFQSVYSLKMVLLIRSKVPLNSVILQWMKRQEVSRCVQHFQIQIMVYAGNVCARRTWNGYAP